MNTVIKLLLYILVILLLVSWMVTVFKSCGQSANPNSVENIVQEEREMDTQDLLESVESEEDFADDLDQILDEEEAGTDYTGSEDIDYSDYDPSNDEVIEEAEEVVAETRNDPVEESNYSQPASSGGNYMVIAGSYIIPKNANTQASKLENMGFKTEVVNFELSQYHTVLAGRFSSEGDAQSIVNRLSGRGIDAYVKKRTR